MDWLPNEDAMQYFINDVMPIVRETIPGLHLTIVGRKPYASLVELARRDANIAVTGRVDDVRPYIEEATAFIVPIRIGGGTRLKIYEAMAMEKPVISTTVGAEGLNINDGEDLVLADSPADFAKAVVRVLQEPDFARQLGTNGAQKVRQLYAWNKVAEKFDSICRVRNI
jgi:glycosyltransferase involved in cell wall biosynthesis